MYLTVNMYVLNISGLNTPVKRWRLSHGFKNKTQLQKPTLNIKIYRLKVKERRKMYYANITQKEAQEVAVLTSDREEISEQRKLSGIRGGLYINTTRRHNNPSCAVYITFFLSLQ